MEVLDFPEVMTPRQLMDAVMERHGWNLEELAERVGREARTLRRVQSEELRLAPKLEERLQKLLAETPEQGHGVERIPTPNRCENSKHTSTTPKEMLNLQSEGSLASDEFARLVDLMTAEQSESDLAAALQRVLSAPGLSPAMRTRAAQAVAETLKARLAHGVQPSKKKTEE